MKQPKSRHASKHRVTEEKARSRQYCVKQRVVAHKCISVVVKGPATQVNSTTPTVETNGCRGLRLAVEKVLTVSSLETTKIREILILA